MRIIGISMVFLLLIADFIYSNDLIAYLSHSKDEDKITQHAPLQPMTYLPNPHLELTTKTQAAGQPAVSINYKTDVVDYNNDEFMNSVAFLQEHEDRKNNCYKKQLGPGYRYYKVTDKNCLAHLYAEIKAVLTHCDNTQKVTSHNIICAAMKEDSKSLTFAIE